MKIRSFRVGIICIALLLNAMATEGQTQTGEQLNSKIKRVAAKITQIKNQGGGASAIKNQINIEFGTGANLDMFVLALVAVKIDKMVPVLEEARVDKQVGGDSGNSGSTSLVSKGSIPSVLGLAVERGALTQDIDGTTITFRGNPVGIVKALGKSGFIESYDDDSQSARLLRKFSFAVSFDSSRGQQAGTLTGDLQQLSSYSFRFDIFNKRDPRNRSYRENWTNLIKGLGQQIADSQSRLSSPLDNDAGFSNWLKSAQQAIINAPAEDVEKVMKDQLLNQLAKVSIGQDIRKELEIFAPLVDSYLSDRNNILELASNAPIITFEYTNTRRTDPLPDLSNFKLIAETGIFKGKADLTANASFTLFNSLPAGRADRLRDFQFAGQLDVPLGEVQKIGNFVLSFSGMYKRRFLKAAMFEDEMLNLAMKDRSRDTAIGQVKLTIPVKGSGVKIPISVTFANRTELIKEKEVRGNIGITFDLDSIFAKFKN